MEDVPIAISKEKSANGIFLYSNMFLFKFVTIAITTEITSFKHILIYGLEFLL